VPALPLPRAMVRLSLARTPAALMPVCGGLRLGAASPAEASRPASGARSVVLAAVRLLGAASAALLGPVEARWAAPRLGVRVVTPLPRPLRVGTQQSPVVRGDLGIEALQARLFGLVPADRAARPPTVAA
jgi:hypothetical protein